MSSSVANQPENIFGTIAGIHEMYRSIAETGHSAHGPITIGYSPAAYGFAEGSYYTFINGDGEEVGVGAHSLDDDEPFEVRVYHGDDFDADDEASDRMQPHEGYGFNYQSHFKLCSNGLLLAAGFRKIRTGRSSLDFIQEYKPRTFDAKVFPALAAHIFTPSTQQKRPSGKGNKEIGAKHGWNIETEHDADIDTTVQLRDNPIHTLGCLGINWT